MSEILQTCRISGKQFLVKEGDQAYYAKMGVPIPTLCPEERLRSRMARRNVRKYYARNCNATGKPIISIYDAQHPNPIYHYEYWHSDAWDATQYARDFDFDHPTWDQFHDLFRLVPLPHMNVLNMENSDYSNEASNCKNTYLLANANGCNDSCYLDKVNSVSHSLDCLGLNDSEWCYQIVGGERCYQTLYSEQVIGCRDSSFLYDCQAVSDSIACVGLRNKKSYLLNEPVDISVLADLKNHIAHSGTLPPDIAKKFLDLKMKHPRKFSLGWNNENSTGDVMYNCKNSKECFFVSDLEDCSYCLRLMKGKDCYDIFQWGYTLEKSYYSVDVGDGAYNIRFSDSIYGGSDIDYSHLLSHCHDCFLCVGLRHKSYCILNKQYSKEEYESTKTRIIEKMKVEGIWGEFFPLSLSPFYYNESPAQEYFPETKEGIMKIGGKWKESFPEVKIPEKATILSSDDLKHLTDSEILSGVMICQRTQRPFRFVKMEIDFYRNMHIPLPLLHPEVRYLDRLRLTNPLKLWDRKCGKCGKDIKTSYAPERPEIVYCEACYLGEVY